MWIVSNQMQMHTNCKIQMRVSKSSTHRIITSNVHPVENTRSKPALCVWIKIVRFEIKIIFFWDRRNLKWQFIVPE